MKKLIFIFLFLVLFTVSAAADNITYRDLFIFLDEAVEKVQPERLNEWLETNKEARTADGELTRANAMVGVFKLAEFLGPDYFCINNWETIVWDNDWDAWSVHPKYWGYLGNYPAGFNWQDEGDSSYDANAYYFSTGRVSLITGTPLFDFDEASGSMRTNDKITEEEAKNAIQRLLESVPSYTTNETVEIKTEYLESTDHNSFVSKLTPTPRIPDKIDEEILSAVEARKEAIRNTPTTVVVTGKTYYVSSSTGRDENSGLSPAKAWKTLSKVNRQKLNPSDAVFFNRGDVWRGECLKLSEGVTYSAYGEGSKPAIYGSPENGASPEKWHLLTGTTNIWVFYKDILECGTIVLNDEEGAFKITAYINNGQFTMPDGSGRPFDVVEALDRNLSFFCYDSLFLKNKNVWDEKKRPGKLYFRCDEGNPGEVYSSIEFNTWCNDTNGHMGILYDEKDETKKPIVVDNLAIKYTGGYGINLGGSAATIQNCEIGWVGGSTETNDGKLWLNAGNCVGSFAEKIENYRVLNCYLYQAFDSGISNEGYGTQKNIEYRGNLIENCVYGIELLSSTEGYTTLENAVIADNIVLNAGYGFGSARQQKRWAFYDASIMIHPYYGSLENVVIEGNTLYLSKGYLIIAGSADKPIFKGNTYIQNDNGGLCLWRSKNRLTEFEFDEQTVKDVLGDAF